MIDWKGKAELKNVEKVDEFQTQKYFSDIFQSDETKLHPTIYDISHEIENYNFYVPILDDNPTMNDLENAMEKLGKGTSIDGLPTSIVNILPYSMTEIILTLIKRVFFGDYPDEWSKQVLHLIAKGGHTSSNPKLRGIAIAPLLGCLYDILIDERFCSWYRPNNEQAGFRAKQGCLLQIFMLILLIVMFIKTTYHPKKSNNRLAEGIKTDYGVTQGRRS